MLKRQTTDVTAAGSYSAPARRPTPPNFASDTTVSGTWRSLSQWRVDFNALRAQLTLL
jgi:hypothetical protein